MFIYVPPKTILYTAKWCAYYHTLGSSFVDWTSCSQQIPGESDEWISNNVSSISPSHTTVTYWVQHKLCVKPQGVSQV